MTQAAVLAQMGNTNQTFRNRIINGAMSFWQRGTSFSNPAVAGTFYTADRWGVNRAGDVSGATVSRSTDVPSGFQYSMKLQRTAGDSSTAGLYLFNSNETVNTLDLAGQPVTLSFWVKAGANYSGGAITINASSGTGTDQRVYAYTGSTAFISTTQAITTTWTRYSFTGTVSSSATEVGFFISWTPTGTAGTDDSIYITGVQLEAGTTATPFEFRQYGTELALCQRYLPAYAGPGGTEMLMYGTQYNNTTNCYVYANFPVATRVAPTGITVSSTSHFRFAGTVANMTMSAMAFSGSSTMGGEIALTGTGGSSLQGGSLQAINTAALVYFTGCEL